MTEDELKDFAITVPFSLSDVERVHNCLLNSMRNEKTMRLVFDYARSRNVSLEAALIHLQLREQL